ncbi:diarrheal toxin [Staphylococcus aureus]|uniref:Diarrheal toxin n=1 Tax=Staphylococcus aureus TaxID=1280 RepID=A0A380DMZ3_STAAU|nr:diarrheal toxin [Staphylococcus aureus]
MHKLIIKYNKQLKMLNLRDGKTLLLAKTSVQILR